MFTILFALLFQLAATAQQPATPKADDLCSVQGVVLKAGTDEPLRKALVEARKPGMGPVLGVAVTDASGRFELKGLDPGAYQLSARHIGFVRQQHGQRNSDELEVTLTLSPGQKISGITFKLVRAAVITGHVYDEDGDPVMGAMISVSHGDAPTPVAMFEQGESHETNDLGEFRISGLPPGQYIVQAGVWGNASVQAGKKESYLPVYYPGVPDARHATPITLRGGDEFSGADITLQSVHAVAVRGRIFNAGCAGAAGQPWVTLMGQTFSSSSVPPATIHEANGQSTFEFPSVPPGSYFLGGMLRNQAGACAGRQTVEVSDSDIDGLALTLMPGIEVRGRVRIEGKSDANPGGVSVALVRKNVNMWMESWVQFIPVNQDGTFLLKDVYDGEFDVSLHGMTASEFLKSARQDGVDVLTGGRSCEKIEKSLD